MRASIPIPAIIAIAMALFIPIVYGQTYVTPTFQGGYRVNDTQTGSVNYVSPNISGGYTVSNPSTGSTSYISQTPNGNYVVTPGYLGSGSASPSPGAGK